MGVSRLRQFARNAWVLKGFVGWRALFRYSKGNLGLELASEASSFALESVVVLAPHPDDEVFGCGGAIRRHLEAGCRVTVLYLLNGSFGNPSGVMDPAVVGLRQQESRNALRVLGGGDAVFWDYPDGQLPLSAETAARLSDFLSLAGAQRIYVPWIGDNHFDHESVARLLAKALEGFDYKGEVWQYEVWAPLVPNRLVPLASALEAKREAMGCFISQLQSTDYVAGILGLNSYRGSMAGLCEPAEAFFASTRQSYLDLNRRL